MRNTLLLPAILGVPVVSIVVWIAPLRGDRRLIEAIHRGDPKGAEELIAEIPIRPRANR